MTFSIVLPKGFSHLRLSSSCLEVPHFGSCQWRHVTWAWRYTFQTIPPSSQKKELDCWSLTCLLSPAEELWLAGWRIFFSGYQHVWMHFIDTGVKSPVLDDLLLPTLSSRTFNGELTSTILCQMLLVLSVLTAKQTPQHLARTCASTEHRPSACVWHPVTVTLQMFRVNVVFSSPFQPSGVSFSDKGSGEANRSHSMALKWKLSVMGMVSLFIKYLQKAVLLKYSNREIQRQCLIFANEMLNLISWPEAKEQLK